MRGWSASASSNRSVPPSASSPTVQTSARRARSSAAVLERAGGRLRHRGRDPRRSVSGQYQSGRAGRLRGPCHRAEVLRVGHAVQRDQERPRVRQQAVEVGLGQRVRRCQHSLGRLGVCPTVDLLRRDAMHFRARVAGEILHVVEVATTDPDGPNPAPARFQQLAHGAATLDLIRAAAHRCQIVPVGVSSSVIPCRASSSRMRSASA